jgi:hypothetical protein
MSVSGLGKFSLSSSPRVHELEALLAQLIEPYPGVEFSIATGAIVLAQCEREFRTLLADTTATNQKLVQSWGRLAGEQLYALGLTKEARDDIAGALARDAELVDLRDDLADFIISNIRRPRHYNTSQGGH